MHKIRYKLILEYLGTNYVGWQKQKDGLSLQQIVEEALFNLIGDHVSVIAAGRTDSGVHAYGQVAHIDLQEDFDPRRLKLSINHFCRPHTIAVIEAEKANNDFHARFSAKQRHYIYKILNREGANIIRSNQTHWIRKRLDIEVMQNAANCLIGKHDFSSFRARECQANSPIKTIDEITITRIGDEVHIHISALSFLHNMVRNIVGTLISIGMGKYSYTKMLEILESKDRSSAESTAPAYGLYFLRVDY